jgi:hypothetical protein
MIIKYNPELIPGIDYNFIVHTVVPATMQDDLIISLNINFQHIIIMNIIA